MRVGYADPPYPGMAHIYRGRADFAGEVDHRELVAQLGDYDAWVLHTASTTLAAVLALCPAEVRIGAWVKSFAAFRIGEAIAYAWEPVVLYGGRPRPLELPTIVDYVIAPAPLRAGCPGAKPEIVCRWAFDLLGLEPDDELVDLFPGSGAVTTAWEAWRAAPRLRQIDWAGPKRTRHPNDRLDGAAW
jgi:hypothetical protein